jgi:hypothetical protein
VPFNVGADEVWSGISYTLAAAMVWAGRHHDAPDLIADALATAKGTHDTSWHSDKNPYWFDVPEAWNRNDPTTFRADQYMRPRAIWELMLALDPQLEDRIKAVAAQGGDLAQRTTDTVAQAPPSRCVDGRTFTFRLHGRGGRVVRAVVYVNGRRVKTVKGARVRRVTIGRLPQRTFRVRITTTTDHGVSTTSVRTYRGCTKTRPKTAVHRPHRRSSKRARPA